MTDLLPCNRMMADNRVCGGVAQVFPVPLSASEWYNAVCTRCGGTVDGSASPEVAAENWNIVQRIPDHAG